MLLDQAASHLGPLSPAARQLILKYIADPTPDRWRVIKKIIVNPRSMRLGTIWQAVCKVDPTFPNAEPEGGWTRVPDGLLVARAIREVTK